MKMQVSRLKIGPTIFKICTIAIYITACLSASATQALPDGLVLIVNEKTKKFGHGFVVDNRLVSAAHVFEIDPTLAIVVQDGSLMKIDLSENLNRYVNEKYGNHALITKGSGFKESGGLSAKHHEFLISLPFDFGWIDLEQNISSVFQLGNDETTLGVDAQTNTAFSDVTIADSASFRSLIASFHNIDELITSIDNKSGLVDSTIAIGELPQDLYLASFSYDSEIKGLLVQTDNRKNINIMLDNNYTTHPGQSGAPLFSISKNGEYIVEGILSSHTPHGFGLPEGSADGITYYVPKENFSKRFKSTLPQKHNSQLSCKGALSI